MTGLAPQVSRSASLTGAFLLAAAASSVLLLDFCDLVYACGCEALWRGAAEQCNIHHAEGPHCPWCSFGVLGGAFVWGSIVVAQAVITLSPGDWRPGRRLTLALLAMPVLGLLNALAFGWATGYWAS